MGTTHEKSTTRPPNQLERPRRNTKSVAVRALWNKLNPENAYDGMIISGALSIPIFFLSKYINTNLIFLAFIYEAEAFRQAGRALIRQRRRPK